MTLGKFYLSPKFIIGILITLFFALSLIYRIVLPYHQIFTSDGIKYASDDAYYHMRIVDSMVHNFPHVTQYDPYFLYPNGASLNSLFFDWLLAGIIMIVGLGSPSAHLINVISVLYPAILAALTIIPVYFIGKTLFNRWAGVIGAGLIAIMPGEFMGRSIMGFTDNHVAETLFSTTALLFLILAIKHGQEKQLTFKHIIQGDWKIIFKPLIYSVLAGVFLGIYLDTWLGAPLFVFIIAAYYVIQFIIAHLKHKSTEHLGIIGFVSFLVALILFIPISRFKDMSIALVIAMFMPLVLSGISTLMSKRRLEAFYYPVIMIVGAVLFIIIFHAAAPSTFNAMIDKFKLVFLPSGSTAATTQEMEHFLSPGGTFSTAVAWGNFTTSFFMFPGWPIPGFAFISFVILIYLFVKKYSDNEGWLLFFIWTLVILVATLVQRRFAYYLVVNIALLSAYISWQVIWLSGLRRLMPEQKEISKQPEIIAPVPKTPQKGEVKSHVTSFQVKKAAAATAAAKKHKKATHKTGFTVYHINTGLAIIMVLVLVFSFNMIKSKTVASQAPYAPSDGWQSSLLWMKDNTPEPFGDPNAYYELFKEPSSAGGFKYPDSAYAVTSWWDYGYWITRIAHRIPNSNPSQDSAPIQKTAELFLSSNETRIQELLKELGSDYIIADYPMSTSKFYAIVNWAGRPTSDFFENYYYAQGNQLIPVQVLTPAYYYCLLTRLFNFDGKAVTQVSPAVITFADKTDSAGHAYQLITDVQQFNSYQEALDYINKEGPSTHKIVGTSPFSSPVPLDAVPDYQLIYSSSSVVQVSDNGTTPEVKIFQYLNK